MRLGVLLEHGWDEGATELDLLGNATVAKSLVDKSSRGIVAAFESSSSSSVTSSICVLTV